MNTIMYPDVTPEESEAMQALADQLRNAADKTQVSGSHYKDMAVQPWTVMEAVLSREEFVGFLKGNIIKYSMRQGKKADSDDAGKAKHYIQKLNEVVWQLQKRA